MKVLIARTSDWFWRWSVRIEIEGQAAIEKKGPWRRGAIDDAFRELGNRYEKAAKEAERKSVTL